MSRNQESRILACPFKSVVVPSFQEVEESQTTQADNTSPRVNPRIRTSADHLHEVVSAATQLYSKRAKYNKESEDILKTGNEILHEQEKLHKAQEALDKAVEALEARKQAAKAALDEIEEGVFEMNKQIMNAFLE